jgi:hypothetical protein
MYVQNLARLVGHRRNIRCACAIKIPEHVYALRLQVFIACMCLIGSTTQSFAADTDGAAAAVERREGVTIGGGDGSSYDKAIIVHAASLTQAMFTGFEYIALRYNWFKISSGSLVRHNRKSYKVLTYEDHRRWVTRNRSAFSTWM